MGIAILKMTPEFFMESFREGKHYYSYEVEQSITNEAELLNVEYKNGLIVATFDAPELPEDSERMLIPKFIKVYR